ncbi:MAG: DUF3179 domain-containing (seleno)protein [Paracoccaceae bacterium]
MLRSLTIIITLGLTLGLVSPLAAHAQSVSNWQSEFPNTDFSKISVPLSEIDDDGNRRDSIPPIYTPKFLPVDQATQYGEFEPVISVTINGEARAYPLQILLWHEMVNDVVGGTPLLVTYCPLCNSGLVFSRILDGETVIFGNTGRLRRLDMIFFDFRGESWWQQITGTAIIGDRVGQKLTLLPSRIESMDAFLKREPAGLVLVPNDPNARPYGQTPFAGIDTGPAPRQFSQWPLPDGINPAQYVVVVGEKAWPLARIRDAKKLREAGLTFSWTAGRNSIHDTRQISEGRDLGNVTVQNADGSDAVYDLVFAFAFSAFIPDGEWMLGN